MAARTALLFLCVLPLFLSPAVGQGQPCPLHRATGVSDTDKTGCYIIKLREDTSEESFQAAQLKVAQLSTDHRVLRSGQRVSKFITVRVADYPLETVSALYI